MSNPLASKSCAIAHSFSDLIGAIREQQTSPLGTGNAISPSRFKATISEFASQFRGADQHDSQEFLAFLLDGLHEDLNQGVGIKGGGGVMIRDCTWMGGGSPKDAVNDDYEEKLDEYVSFARRSTRARLSDRAHRPGLDCF
jgi:hypothetical protein